MEELGDFLLLKKENDTKSSIEFVAILRILLQNRGIDQVSLIYLLVLDQNHVFFQSSYSTTASGFHFVKKLLSNPLRGANDINEMVFEGQIAFIHLVGFYVFSLYFPVLFIIQ
jgi:hypothetical protein